MAVASAARRAVLVLLVAQNTSLVLLMRHSRTEAAEAKTYRVSVAVVCAELLKLVICLSMIGSHALGDQLRLHLVVHWRDFLKVGVPAGLYTGQNYLLFVALSHLDAGSFQVLYQLKTLATALFSVLILGKHLRAVQWLGLCVLSLGVIAVQRAPAAAGSAAKPTVDPTGLAAVACAAASSGLSSVYFEKLLKHSTASLWVRNVQLGAFALPIAVATMVWTDGTAIRRQGLFFGFNGATLGVVALNAAGGLLVAAVMKYADNIIKTFATVISIVLSTAVSTLVFGAVPTAGLAQGVVCVCASVVLYSWPGPGPSLGAHSGHQVQGSAAGKGVGRTDDSKA